jgi:chromosome segregation protein
LNVHSEVDHTPVVEQITVEIGYETALGAALGEDLDASLDEAAAVRWGSALAADGDPGLPGQRQTAAGCGHRPKELHRRLSQIGIGFPGRRSGAAV